VAIFYLKEMGQKYRTEDRKAQLMVGKKRGRINHAK